jgi:hypothetical protein
VSPTDGYQQNHVFSFAQHYRQGILSISYHPSHNMLFVAGPTMMKNADSLKVLVLLSPCTEAKCEMCSLTLSVEHMVKVVQINRPKKEIAHVQAFTTTHQSSICATNHWTIAMYVRPIIMLSQQRVHPHRSSNGIVHLCKFLWSALWSHKISVGDDC